MRCNFHLLLLLLIAGIPAGAQRIEIRLAGKRAVFADTGLQSQPLLLSFAPEFRGHKVGFYSRKSAAALITSGRFGTDIPPNAAGYYEVSVRGNAIGWGSTFSPLTGNGIELNVDSSGFSRGIRLGKAAPAGSGSGTPVAPGAAAHVAAGSTAINDAIAIARLLRSSPANNAGIAAILKAYGIRSDTDLKANAFLASVINISALIENSSDKGEAQSTSILSGIGGVDVTTIADGFARFIVQRTKKELAIAFFDNFRKKLQEYPDLNGLFPQTAKLLQSIDAELYDYNNYIANLRAAFRSDLQGIDEQLPALADRHRDLLMQPETIGFNIGLRAGCYVSTSLKQDMHPGDLLAGFPMDLLDTAISVDATAWMPVKGSLQLLQLFSESLRESEAGRNSYWVGMEKLRQLGSDKDLFKVYMGLVLQLAGQRYEGVVFDNKTSFYAAMNSPALVKRVDNSYSVFQSFRTFFLGFGTRVGELNTLIASINADASDSVRAEQYLRYFKASTQFLQYSVQVTRLPGLDGLPALNKLPNTCQPYFAMAEGACNLASAIVRKDYPGIVNHLLSLYNNLLQLRTAPAAASSLSLASGAPVTTSVALPAVADAQSQKTAALLARYGSFMVNMIDAQSSADVAAAIESVALPAGSARVKRNTATNVAINAYCGLFWGREVIKGYDADKVFSKWNAFGLTAPIGVSFSKGNALLPWPLSRLPLGHWKGASASWFLSLVDLGAVAAFRFRDDGTEQVPTIKLKDIFSPGIFWSVGFPRTPISVNLGVQAGPNLRKVTAVANDFSDKIYVRYSMSFCVDLPLLNIVTK
jgi:hypothetical protein